MIEQAIYCVCPSDTYRDKASLRLVPRVTGLDRGDWVPLHQPQEIGIGQKGGSETNVTLTHEAQFQWQGHNIRLVPTHWKSGKPMFVIRDETSGTQTYAASRFLIAEAAINGRIELDFNRAHNPPCAFTEFAICPLPPAGNVLPFELTAGELLPQSD